MKKNEIKDRTGETNINTQGIPMIITKYVKSNDIEVLFLNGSNETVKSRYDHFKDGKIKCKSYLFGKSAINSYGDSCTVVLIIDSNTVLVEWQDKTRSKLKNSLFNNKLFIKPKTKYNVSRFTKIPNYSSYYADQEGNIYNNRGEKLITSDCGRGYRNVSLVNDKGVIKTVLVHRIIATTFLPTENYNLCVNHINGNKSDNRVSNLEWCTYKQNQLHAIYTLKKAAYGENNGRSKLTESQVKEIIDLANNGLSKPEIAFKFKISLSTLYSILSGDSWSYLTNIESKRRKYKTLYL